MFLIYPYWNVNNDSEDESFNDDEVSNLSILECK